MGWKILVRFVLAFISIAIAYFLAAIVLSLIPVNRTAELPDEITIYLVSNGVHLDLLLPIENDVKNWNEEVSPHPEIKAYIKYVGIGWGDKEFYLETPQWSDLRFSVAIRALSGKNPSAIHVNFYNKVRLDHWSRKLQISKEQYHLMVGFIEQSFKQDESGRTIIIPGAGYNQYDLFYEANQSYSLFYTCNTWTNSCLKHAGLPACAWTPFDKGVLLNYPDGVLTPHGGNYK